MKLKVILFLVGSFFVVGLTGCTNNSSKKTAETTTTSEVSKTVSDYLTGLDARGLTADNQTAIDVTSLDSSVAAKEAVKFSGESNTAMMLLQFNTQEDALKAQDYYVGQDKRTHTDQRLLLVADRTLGKEWFEKYQKGIFQQ